MTAAAPRGHIALRPTTDPTPLSCPVPGPSLPLQAKWNETLVAVKLLLSLQDIQKVTGPEAALTLSSPVLFNLQKVGARQ